MNLTQMPVDQFIYLLGSDAPAPGGGSAAALAASIGISLTKMVTELTVDKKKYQEHEQVVKEVQAEAGNLQQQLLAAIDEDTAAFNQVSAVFSMPKETAAEKKARKAALQTALKGATKAPFAIMQASLLALELTEKLIGKSNTNAASDLGVAALSLKTALQGAWLNVLINLSSIDDEEFVTKYQTEGQNLLIQGSQLADEIYQQILNVV